MRSHQFLTLFLLPCLLSCQQAAEETLLSFSSKAPVEQQKQDAKPVTSNILFQSADGGHSWQDVSAGLPLDTKAEDFFANEGELLLTATNGVYRANIASENIKWETEMFLKRPISSVSASGAGIIAVSDNRKFFQKLTGTDVWMPVFTDLKGSFMRTIYTAKNGNIFIGHDDGLNKSVDGGKTWKNVMQNGWVIKMVESDGVLLCTNERGILRSEDGETWEVVLSKGGVGIDVESIKNGFAAIVYEHGSETRRICTSNDGGKTWQTIDAGLPPSKLISSVLQLGDTFYCGHPEGIFRSDDLGKSWQLVFPTIGKKVFELSISNGVMYALLREGGC